MGKTFTKVRNEGATARTRGGARRPEAKTKHRIPVGYGNVEQLEAAFIREDARAAIDHLHRHAYR